MYNKVSKDMKFIDREQEVLAFWKDNKIFEKSIVEKQDLPTYTFYDGPPTANGKPHIGHVLTRVIKDMVPRYQTMKGHKIIRKAGWDTHGLPVELEIEKKLGIDGKEQIEAYGLDPFIKQCKESVWQYKGMWEEFSGKVGFWADMDDPYVTYHDTFIESEWWALKKIWDDGLLYKGFKIVPYCPRCGTPLSSHEVAQGYKTVKERSAVVRFKCVDEDAYFLAWTTTPWTLPSNVALCVNPDETYCKVKAADGRTYYMAQALLDAVLGKLSEDGAPAYEILETYKGIDLEHKEYEPLFECTKKKVASLPEKGHYITCDSYVTMSDGTGIVHIAPAFGEDDAQVGRKYGLPFVQFVNGKGEMTEETPYAGMWVKDADNKVLVDLDNDGLLFDAPKFEHEYPHCWRCDRPLIYYARDTWFIKMSAVKDKLVANNNTVNWIPEGIGKGRFGAWLENVQDWGLSRNRSWGTPLNIWECSCGKRHAIGSIEELKSMSKNCPDQIELHRPYIDEVTITCPDCGGEMKRVPEVIDCWFDSGAMPFAQWHYPFENKEIFDDNFPADFISEAVDQTRGWFYSLMAISTLLFDKAPYKNVIVLGHVLDKDGNKMSKSKGNAVDPMEALNKFGADAIRWYFYSNSAPWLPNRFHEDAVKEGQSKFIGTYWNTYAFYVMYADIDNFDPTQYKLDVANLCAMDRWILSRLNTLTKVVDEKMSAYDIFTSARLIQDFTDELSNWYVRRGRERYWAGDMNKDKVDAFMTLYTVLEQFTRLCAPFVPFVTESIYQNIVRSVDKNAPESVHLCDYPVADESLIDVELEKEMALVRSIVELGRAARNAANVKNRQPMSDIYIVSDTKLDEEYQGIVRDELNIKNVQVLEDASSLMDYKFKPQLRTCGRKFGPKLNAAKEVIAALPGKETMDKLSAGAITLTVDGEDFEMTTEDFIVETVQLEGLSTQSDKGVTVSINTVLTPELLEEGLVREIISKIQNIRKKTEGLNVTDRIAIVYSGNEKISEVISKNCEYIASEVLAVSLEAGETGDNAEACEANGEKFTVVLKRA